MDSFNSGSSFPPNQPPLPHPDDPPEVKEEKLMEHFWHQQRFDYKNKKGEKPPELVPGRIKKIMKSDKNVKLISSDAPKMLAKVCEVFIQELTFRGCMIAEAQKKSTLNHCHVSMAVKKDKVFDFLANVPNCGHEHHDDVEVNAGNIMMNVEQMIARNQDVIERNQQQLIIQPPYLSSDHSRMMMSQYLPYDHQYLLSDQHQFQTVQCSYLSSDQPQTMQLSYLSTDQSQSQLMLPSYLPSNQSQMMQPPYQLPDQSQIIQHSYLSSDQSQMTQPPYLPSHPSQILQHSYLSSNQSQMTQSSYLPSDQPQMMVPQYFPSETMQPPPYQPSEYPSYNFHPK